MPNESGGGGIGGTLKAKLGPLPTWAWLAIITVVLLGYWLYEQHKQGSTASTGQQTSPQMAGQPGVVVINQDEPDQDTGQPIPMPPVPQPHPGHKPPKPPEKNHTRGITVTKDMTLGELAKQRHWSTRTLQAVEEENVTQGGGEWTPSTRLKKGQEVIRPLRH